MQFVLYALLAYIAYNFIFKLVIPVYMASRKIKRTFREVHSRMQEQQAKQQGFTPQASSTSGDQSQTPKKKLGDYIDFEEVK
jgi:hypothetical protein